MRFLRLNKVVNKLDINCDELMEKKDNLAVDLEWTKAEYARDLFWIKEGFFHNDVEIPDEEVSLDDFQTETGQKKAWNRFLTKLTSDYDNGTLYNKILDEYFKCVLIIPQENYDLYFDIDEKLLPLLDYTDVTDEYSQIINDKMDKNEIENFVENHTPDEIKRKYHVFGWDENFWEW